MRFFGFPISEWSILLGIIVTIGGVLMKLVSKKINRFVDAIGERFGEPLREDISKLTGAIGDLSRNVDTETKWVHERHSEVVDRLDRHSEKIDDLDDKVIQHDERIKTLFRNKEDRRK